MGHINLAFAYVASPLFENYRKPKKHDEEMGKMFQQHITQVHAGRNQARKKLLV